MVSDVVKKLINEVRYIDVSHKRGRDTEKSLNMGWDNYDAFKDKVISNMETYFKWNVKDMSRKGGDDIILFLKPTKDANKDAKSIANYLKSLYGFKYPMSIRQQGNGLYVGFHLKKDSNYDPIGKHEKIRVFHGTDIKTASAARNGQIGHTPMNMV